MGVMEHECRKYKIAATDELIHEGCVTQMKRILNDPKHPVTKDITSANLEPDKDENNNNLTAGTTSTNRITRNKFEFDIALCKTERHMNTFVPKYMRVLEKSGFTTEAAKRRAAEAAKQEEEAAAAAARTAKARKAAKAKVACFVCGNHYVEGAGIANHERFCKKAKTITPTTNYSELPDFLHNYQFVTTRRP